MKASGIVAANMVAALTMIDWLDSATEVLMASMRLLVFSRSC
jgi:hypothetical protein